jgi:hypothetical protein
MSEALLAAGARLMFGHDWRPDGIMDAICRLAIQHQPSGSVSAREPLIQSLLAWPTKSSMEPTLCKELEQRGVFKIEMLPPSTAVPAVSDCSQALALSLVDMRKELAKRCHARVCLGGNSGRNSQRPVKGLYAGVIEEARRTADAGRPVYAGSFMGGVCAEAVRALREESSNEVFQVVNRKMHQEIIKQCKTLASDLPVDLRSSFDVSALQQRSGLEIDEWHELLQAPDTESFITWVIRGLRNVSEQLLKPKDASPEKSTPPVRKSAPRRKRASKKKASK